MSFGADQTQPVTDDEVEWFCETFDALVARIERALVGKTHIVRLALTTLVSGGHLLLEDVPGTGKTSLAREVAASVRGTTARIQFTPDLLPSDITGVSIFNQRTTAFEFHPGPIFAHIVLADEINRASPKTQAALLEVMDEARVTIDGQTHPVPAPFMVIATQNPIEQAGTYPLPEAQLDRFLMRSSIGYPDHASLVRILGGPDEADRGGDGRATTETIERLAGLARRVHVDATINDYVSRLVAATREAEEVRLGVSVRGALALVAAAKTYAAASGRTYVVPDDVKSLAEPVWAHRIVLAPEAEFAGVSASNVVAHVLMSTPPPTEGSVQ